MLPGQVDYFFPFLVFFYGVLLTFVLESSLFSAARLGPGHQLYQRLIRHRGLAWICLFVGGFWSLQNIIFG